MQKEIQFDIIKDGDGETTVNGIKCEMRALFAYRIKAFEMDGEAKRRNVEILITVYGAKLDANTRHVIIGFKICDKKARGPVTGKYILSSEDGLCDEEHLDNMQSGAWCFPILAHCKRQ
jgi:hypothetical protein